MVFTRFGALRYSSVQTFRAEGRGIRVMTIVSDVAVAAVEEERQGLPEKRLFLPQTVKTRCASMPPVGWGLGVVKGDLGLVRTRLIELSRRWGG